MTYVVNVDAWAQRTWSMSPPAPVFIIISVVSIMLLITVFLRLLPVRAFLTVTAVLCMLQLALVFNSLGQHTVDCGDWATEIGLRRVGCGTETWQYRPAEGLPL